MFSQHENEFIFFTAEKLFTVAPDELKNYLVYTAAETKIIIYLSLRSCHDYAEFESAVKFDVSHIP